MNESTIQILSQSAAVPRVAMLFLWNLPLTNQFTGGILYGLANVGQDLKRLGFDVRYLYISNWHKPNPAIHPGFSRVDATNLQVLNEFDFVVFNTPGSGLDKKSAKAGPGPNWLSILRSLRTPFAVQIHDEVEAKIAFRREFFEHPECRLLLPITHEIVDLVVGDINGQEVLVYPCFSTLDTSNPAQYYGMKTDSVVTTCRITARKRIVELVQRARSLAAAGFELHVHGADPAWQYALKVKEHANESWKYHGAFTRSELPKILAQARFHYNAAFLKRGPFIPRIEISTVEAVSYGCCPILCRATVPRWVDDTMGILVDPLDMGDLSDRLRRERNEAPTMNERFCRALAEHNSPERTFKLARFIADTVKVHAHTKGQPSPQGQPLEPELSKVLDHVELGKGQDSAVLRFLETRGFLRPLEEDALRSSGRAPVVDRPGLHRYLQALRVTSFRSFVNLVQ